MVAECCCRYRSLNLPRLKERPSVKCLISTIFFFFFPEAKLLHFDNNGSITSTKCQISEIRASLALYYCRLVSFLFIYIHETCSRYSLSCHQTTNIKKDIQQLNSYQTLGKSDSGYCNQ